MREETGGTRGTQEARSGAEGDRHRERTGFACCGPFMQDGGDGAAMCPCIPLMRRHPVLFALMLAMMGLAAVLIPTGMILGMIAFFRLG